MTTHPYLSYLVCMQPTIPLFDYFGFFTRVVAVLVLFRPPAAEKVPVRGQENQCCAAPRTLHGQMQESAMSGVRGGITLKTKTPGLPFLKSSLCQASKEEIKEKLFKNGHQNRVISHRRSFRLNND